MRPLALVITFMLYFARTTSTCRPTYITILQCELDIYIFSRFQHCLEGGGATAPTIFEVPSYLLGTDGDGTSRSLCTWLQDN